MIIKVTCAIILHQQKILVAKRSKDMPHPGFWEFPGGKVEDGESEDACLQREILEELNCHIKITKELPHFNYKYPDKEIELIPFICAIYQGIPRAIEHEKIDFLNINQLNKLNWLPADIEIKNYLKNNLQKILLKLNTSL